MVGLWDDCASVDLGGREDWGVERMVEDEEERVLAGKLVTSSMSMSSAEWVAA